MATAQPPPPLKATGRPFNPFQSPRLIYRGVEDSPEEENFFYTLVGDAEAQSGTQPWLLTPESKTTSQKSKKAAQESFMSAVICLKPSETTTTITAGNAPAPTPSTSTSTSAAAPTNTPQAPIPIGLVVLATNGGPGGGPSYAHHRHCYLSVDIVREYRGMGYGSEAVEWALGYAFRIANLHRVIITAFGYNEGAVRLYRRLGFVEEGCLRDELWWNGEWHNCFCFGMLEDEWRAKQETAKMKWGE